MSRSEPDSLEERSRTIDRSELEGLTDDEGDQSLEDQADIDPELTEKFDL
jgi:hypothetical protein